MPFTERSDILKQLARGKGWFRPLHAASGSGTAAAAASGHFLVGLAPNAIGTTLPSTIQTIPFPAAVSQDLRSTLTAASWHNAGRAFLIGYAYKFGSVNLTATGDRFTAQGGVTFPYTRIRMGQASQPVSLLPLVQVTTALTGSAAVFTLKTAAGGTGYVDEQGNNVVGTKTFTFPSATTAISSCFIPRLEDGDNAVRSIAAVQVNTASTAGIFDFWGIEPMIIVPSFSGETYLTLLDDAVFGGLHMLDLKPATPTSGTGVDRLVALCLGSNANNNLYGFSVGVVDLP